MDSKHIHIIQSSVCELIGKDGYTNLHEIVFDDGVVTPITGRAHLGNGLWKLWNSDSAVLIEAQEID